MAKEKRLKILTEEEINQLYSRPNFTEEEQVYFFELSRDEEELLAGPFDLSRKIYSIILLGYFKAKQQLFTFDLRDVEKDAQYIIKRYFTGENLKKMGLARETKRLSQLAILKLTGYRLYRQDEDAPILLNKALELCSISIDPVFILRELLAVLAHQKIIVPGYTTFQEQIISKALNLEQRRISEILKLHLTAIDRQKIFGLFDHTDNFYALTALKKKPKNFRMSAIRKEIGQYHQYKPLYEISLSILPKLKISKNAISYYASLVEHYTVRGLNRMKQDQTCLWLLCFIHHRYQNMLDNLATMFIYTMNQYETHVAEKAQELLLKQVLQPSEKDFKIAKLLRFYTDQSIDLKQAFGIVRNSAYTILAAPQIDQIADELEDKNQKGKQLSAMKWQAVDLFVKTYKPLLRALLQVLVLESNQHKSLQKA